MLGQCSIRVPQMLVEQTCKVGRPSMRLIEFFCWCFIRTKTRNFWNIRARHWTLTPTKWVNIFLFSFWTFCSHPFVFFRTFTIQRSRPTFHFYVFHVSFLTDQEGHVCFARSARHWMFLVHVNPNVLSHASMLLMETWMILIRLVGKYQLFIPMIKSHQRKH